jgi:nitroreductase
MQVYEAIRDRRSVRRYKKDPVPREVIERIMDMAVWAPSGMNRQNWFFLVITGEKKASLVEIIAKSYRFIEPVLQKVFAEKPGAIQFTKAFFERLGDAPVVIFAYYTATKEKAETSIQSVAAAVQNLLLAAHAEGLGACWMTGPLHVADEINEFLAIEDKTLVAVISLGYPDETPPAPKRKSGRVVYEGFPDDRDDGDAV